MAQKDTASKSESKSVAQSKSSDVITIDGIEYQLDQLSTEVNNQIINVRLVDQEIRRLQIKLAIAQTARAAYAKALKVELENLSAK